MELMAAIAALQELNREGVEITLYSDSSYIVNTVEKGWLFNWAKNDYKGKKNADLWAIFLTYYKKHKIKFVWVKGHADNPYNNRCDILATEAADSKKWAIDEGYENNMGNKDE